MQREELEALAGEVVLLMKAALTPMLARVTALEARPLVPGPPGIQGLTGEAGPIGANGSDGAPGRDGRDGLPGVPGATGEKGLAGADGHHGTDGIAGKDGVNGTNGLDGKDGAAGLSFEGVHQDGKFYDVGHLVTWAGSSWHCNEPTTTKPGDGSKAWTLMVKRGRDGKDGVDAPGALPVVKVR